MLTTTDGAGAVVADEGVGGAPSHPVRVRTPAGELTFDCRRREPILYAGLRQGVSLPYACATGTCGSCRLRGDPAAIALAWPEAPGRAKLKAEHDLLLCQTLPQRACAIESRSALAPWPAEMPNPDYARGRITSRCLVGRDVLAFSVALDRAIDFLPGQFVVIRVPSFPGYRAYSMTNADRATAELGFVIRRKPDGRLSRWLFDEDYDGTTIEVFGPLGGAVLAKDEDADLLVIAGSTGIAGPMAILSRAAADGLFARRRADVFFGVRTLADAFFLDVLAALAARAPEQLRVTLALSDEEPAAGRHPAFPAIALAHGDVHAVAGREIGGPRHETLAFLAGPPPMVDAAIRMLLTRARLPAAAIRYDRFW